MRINHLSSKIILFITLASIFLSCDNIFFTPKGENNSHLIIIPTYDGSGQAVHPDILKISNDKYYLAFTPYPYSDDQYENPSILFSNNGIDFDLIPKFHNPIISSPSGTAYNNDPDISYYDSTYYIIYQETFLPDSQNIILIQSNNSIDWSEKKTIIHQNLTRDDKFSVSPTLIRIDSLYNLFYVDISGNYKIKQLSSSSIMQWDYNSSNVIDINMPDNFNPWHIDIFKDNYKNRYYMLISGFKNSFIYQDLYIAYSDNLTQWSFIEKPIIKHSPSFYNSRSIYRSSGIIESSNNLLIYFSFRTYSNEWKIGLKEFKLSETIN